MGLPIANLIHLGEVALGAVSDFRQLYEQVKPGLSATDEAELRPLLERLAAQNDQLYGTVQEKLKKAAEE